MGVIDLMKRWLPFLALVLAAIVTQAEPLTEDVWRADGAVRRVLSLDGTWQISPLEFLNELPERKVPPKEEWTDCPVPYDWFGVYWDRLQTEVPNRKTKWLAAWYRRTISLPNDLPDGRFLLEFDGVDYQATLFVNGVEAGRHTGTWASFRVDVTRHLRRGQENTILLYVAVDTPIDGKGGVEHAGGYRRSRHLQFNLGGIHQSVRLRLLPRLPIDLLLIDPRVSESRLDLTVRFASEVAAFVGQAKVQIFPWMPDGQQAEPVFTGPVERIVRQPDGSFEMSVPAGQLKLWDLDSPNLYRLRLTIEDQGKVVDEVEERFGYREFLANGRGFFLNGRPIFLFGECNVYVDLMDRKFFRNKSRSDLRYLTTLYSQEEYESRTRDNPEFFRAYIKHLKACRYNLFRMHAGPWPKWPHDVCDEEGILLMPEWGHGSHPDLVQDLSEMRDWLYRSYNNPSVALYSLMNESPYVSREAERYQRFRPLEKSNRPMTATAGGNLFELPVINQTDIYDTHLYYGWGGYPASFMPDAYEYLHQIVKRHRGQVDKPFIITESNIVLGGDINAAIPDEQLATLSLDEYLSQIKEAPKAPDGRQLKMMPLASIDTQTELRPSWLAAQFVKKLVEQFRIRDDLVQGLIPWQAYVSQGKHNFQPVFVGTELNYEKKAEFAGHRHQFAVYLRSYDPQLHSNAQVEIWVEDLAGKTVLRGSPIQVGDIKAGMKQDYAYEWDIPADLPSGNYLLRLRVGSGDSTISTNVYELFVISSKDAKPVVTPSAAVAVLRPRGLTGPNEINVPDVLSGLGIKHEVINSLDALDQYGVLIVPAYYGEQALDRKPILGAAMAFQLTEEEASFKKLTERKAPTWAQVYPEISDAKQSARLRQWVESGGKVLAFEQFLEGPIPWQPGVSIRETGFNTFVDPVRLDHPALKCLMTRNFADWEGERGVIIDYSLFPLNENLIATVSSYGYAGRPSGMAMAIAEAKIGHGASFVSQLDAIRRYGNDSTATLYVNQIIHYVVSGDPWDQARNEAETSR